jgi:ferredoxin-NADP reductase
MAMVKKYPARIITIENKIAGVYTLKLSSSGKPFQYSPGQFLHLAIDSDYDGIGQWPDSRCFSMQSNPDEETMRITFAVKGSFTQRMAQTLKIGDEVWLKLPYGDLFTQPHNKENAVFIAGGTGITPFLSLFTHKSFNEYLNPRIYLGFRSKKHNIYKAELNAIKLHASSLEPCVTKIYYEDADGIIDVQRIISENINNSFFFISGPQKMISSFKKLLISSGIPGDHIKSDEWV